MLREAVTDSISGARRRRLAWAAGSAGLLTLALPLTTDTRAWGLRTTVCLIAIASFFVFTLLHAELARRKPAPAFATSFYLTISLGGAIGALLVALAAPLLLNVMLDLQIILTAACLLVSGLVWRETQGWNAPGSIFVRPADRATGGLLFSLIALYCLARISVPLLFPLWDQTGLGDATDIWAITATVLLLLHLGRQAPRATAGRALRPATLLVALAIGAVLLREATKPPGDMIRQARNLYGTLRVYENDNP